MAETVELQLVIIPQRGVIKPISFGYNALNGQVDKVAFLTQGIKRQYQKLAPDSPEVQRQLTEIVTWFHPGHSPLGRFVVDIPGEIDPDPLPQPQRAAPVGPSAEELKRLIAQSEERERLAQQDRQRAREEAKKAADELNKVSSERDFLRQRLARLEQGERERKAEYDSLHQQFLQARQDLAAAQQRLDLLRRQPAESGPKLAQAQQRIAAMQAENSRLAQERNTYQKQVQSLEDELEEANRRIEELEEELSRARLDTPPGDLPESLPL